MADTKPSPTAKPEPRLVCHLRQMMEERCSSKDKDKPMTAREIHEQAGVSMFFISKLRKNSFESLHAENLVKLCRFLDVTLDDLFSIEP